MGEPGRRGSLVFWSADPLEVPEHLWAERTVLKDGVRQMTPDPDSVS